MHLVVLGLETLGVLLWLAVGTASFIFWWTQEYDCDFKEVPMLIIGGLCGPLTFLGGFFEHWHPLVVWRFPRWSRRPGVFFDCQFVNPNP